MLCCVGALEGCSGSGAPKDEPISSKGWTRHEAKSAGIAFELPEGWSLANEANGKVQVKQDEEAIRESRQLFDDISMVASASESGSSAKTLIATYTILSLKPKKMPSSPQELLTSTLADLTSEYPSGDPKGAVFDAALGKTVLTSYTDAATKGNAKGGTPDVVDVMNIQFRILHGDRILLLNLTGEKSKASEVQKLAEQLLKHVSYL